MNYHLDTIPVWDAMKLGGECLLCSLRRKMEVNEVERFLGASVMEPDTRIQVNRKGFCKHHQEMLFAVDNRLGHALMLESHLAETRQRLDKALKAMKQSAQGISQSSLIDRLSGKAPSPKKALEADVSELEKLTDTCVICDSIDENMERYLRTFFHLYQNESDFRRALEASKGFCLPHTAQLMRFAPKALNAKELGEFASTLSRLETEAFDRIQEDVSWFIKKFDYRFAAEPWKDSRDAVERSVNKLRGWCIGQEPYPDESKSSKR